MAEVIDWLWFHTWWESPAEGLSSLEKLYRFLNLVEGLVWMNFFVSVLVRRARQPAEQRTLIEFAYAFAFLCFALTDFQETVALTSWLVWAKLINLIALLWLRKRVMTTLYPEARVY
ncbi:MAG: hypothetical protein AAF711_18220 [Planctomycetota bacterium]